MRLICIFEITTANMNEKIPDQPNKKTSKFAKPDVLEQKEDKRLEWENKGPEFSSYKEFYELFWEFRKKAELVKKESKDDGAVYWKNINPDDLTMEDFYYFATVIDFMSSEKTKDAVDILNKDYMPSIKGYLDKELTKHSKNTDGRRYFDPDELMKYDSRNNFYKWLKDMVEGKVPPTKVKIPAPDQK